MAVQQQGIQITSIRLQWKIVKFRKLRVNEEVVSSEFVFGADNTFHLRICRFKSDIYRFYMHALNEITSDLPIHWEFSFVDRFGRERFIGRDSETFEEGEDNIMIRRMDFIKQGKDLLVDDTLTVCCIISVDGDVDVLESSTTETKASLLQEADSTKLLKTLSSNFEKLYEDKTDTDCVLKAGDTEFPVHRTVLSARSSVFSAMFHHDTSERSSGEANILDVEAATLSDVLHYIYSGKIRGLTADTAVSMFTVADKYAILELRDECLQFLVQNLNTANICDAALLSHTHGEETLENKVVSFIDINIKQVLDSDEWKEFFAANHLIAGKFLSAAYLQRIN